MESGAANPPPAACCRRPPNLEALQKKYADWLKPCLKSSEQVLAFLKQRFTLEAGVSPYEKIIRHSLLQPDPDRDAMPQDSLVLESFHLVRDGKSEAFYRNRRDSEEIYVTFCHAAGLMDGNDVQCLIDVERGISQKELEQNEVLPFLDGIEALEALGETAYLAARKREIDARPAEETVTVSVGPTSPLPPGVNHRLVFFAKADSQSLVGFFASAGKNSRGDTLTKIAFDSLAIVCPGYRKTLPATEALLPEAEAGEYQEYVFAELFGIPPLADCEITAKGLRFYSQNHSAWLDLELHERLRTEEKPEF